MGMPLVVALASVKGAPGVTTLGMGMAALWPDKPGAVLLECNPDGGDLAARFGHHPDPGLTSLAAAARTRTAPLPIAAHTQRLAVGADVVLAPPGDAAGAAVAALAYAGPQLLRHLTAERSVILDVGRLSRGGPGLALAAAADIVLLVVGADLASQAQVAARLPWLKEAVDGRLWLIIAGRGPYKSDEIAASLGVPVLWTLPRGRMVAATLRGELRVPNWFRLGLGHAMHEVATTLVTAQPATVVAQPQPNPRRVEVPS